MNKTAVNKFQLISSAFNTNNKIPERFTCKGENSSPPLEWRNSPAQTKSFALICDDPDAPNGTWDHWVVYNIPPHITSFSHNVSVQALGAIDGTNSWHQMGYGGPCPPSGTHHYYFTVYALDTMLTLAPGATKEELLQAMKGHVLAQAQLVGLASH